MTGSTAGKTSAGLGNMQFLAAGVIRWTKACGLLKQSKLRVIVVKLVIIKKLTLTTFT
jgi:hypothetical protein